MYAVEVSHVAKAFGSTQAVANVSFSVNRGEIFGLLGPNGAGKTTTIRLMLDIFKPDSGTIAVLGGVMTEAKKSLIGYMPEDRGLYQDWALERCLLYLASLKGMTRTRARSPLEEYLERFDLAQHRKKRIKDLSKGMQQKAQLISTLLHEPVLIIIDEPFTALDPINIQMVKDLMRALREQGATIIMSTHQMHHAEELCDSILIIDDGQNVIYGDLNNIRRQYAGHNLLVRTIEPLPALAGVEQVSVNGGTSKITLVDGNSPQHVLRELVKQHITVEQFEIAMPSLDEIFIHVVKEGAK